MTDREMTGREPGAVTRFIGAAGALVVLAIAMPLVLARLSILRFGSANPVAGVSPSRWKLAEAADALQHPLTDDTVIDALVRVCLIVAWVAVAVIVTTTVAEVIHIVRHGGVSMPSVRMLGWAQPVARTIAIGLLVVAPTMSPRVALAGQRMHGSSTIRAVPAVTFDNSTPPLDTPGQSRSSTTPTEPSYVVQHGDSIYSIAERLTGGDERRTMEVANAIVEANLGVSMTSGATFTSPAYIEPGWVLRMPASVATGSLPPSPPAPPPSMTDSSAGDDAGMSMHVVAPGDTLWDIARDELGSGTRWTTIWDRNAGTDMGDGRTFDDPNLILPGWHLAVPHDDPTSVDSPVMSPEQPPVGTPLTTEAIATASSADASPVAPATTDSLPPDLPVAAVARPDTTPGTGSTSTTSTTSPAVADARPADAPSVERGGAADAPSPLRLEHAAMLAAGVLALVGVRRRQRLRAARPRSRVPEPRPEVIETERMLRRIEPGERAARVDVACRAAARALVGSGVQIAVVRVTSESAVTLVLTGDAPAPAPFTGEGRQWKLSGSVPIEFLAESARQVGMPCVAFVQLGVDDAGAEVMIDLEAVGLLAVDAPPTQADSVIRALAAGLATSIFAEVAHLVTVALPEDVLLGHRNAHRVESIDAAYELAAVLAGTTSASDRTSFELRSLHTGGEMWEPTIVLLTHADHAGTATDELTIPPPGHGLAIVTAVAPDELCAAPARLRAQADHWAFEFGGESLALTPIGLDRVDVEAVVDVIADADRPLLPLDEVEPVEALADAHEFVPADHAIVVRLLGGVSIADLDGKVGNFERSKTIELIAWLATHRARSTRSAARTAMWEMDVRDATFANVVSEARRALARMVAPPVGEEWLGRTLTDQLPLHPLVVTDAQLIEERLAQARLSPPALAIATLRPAVELVGGVPFAGSSYLWPDAEGISSNLVLLAITASAELAAHALSSGDIETVFWSTGRGLGVLPGHEELIALRMRAHAMAGDLAGVRNEWETYERVLVADSWSDGEPAPKMLALRRELLSGPSTG